MKPTETSMPDQKQRSGIIMRTSLIGIGVNALLAAAKAVIGWLTGSLAVTLDGVNNLSDAGSSIITMISTKLAGKPADKKHPFGYGRTEYISTLVIALIILYAGISSLSESIQKIIEGGTPSYSSLSLWILFFAVLVKIALGLYTIREGKKAGSGSLDASGKDALNDSIMSSAVLISALIFQFTGVSLEAWVGLVISGFIIKSGIDIIRESLSEIIGERMDKELAREIKEEVRQVPGVLGAYDLFFHDYGPERKIASIHIEVPEDWSAARIDAVSREIEQKIYRKYHVIFSAVGIYSKNTSDPDARRIEKEIRSLLDEYPHILQMHGFYVREEPKQIRFDLIIDFNAKNRHEEYQEILEACRAAYPDYDVSITLDADLSD